MILKYFFNYTEGAKGVQSMSLKPREISKPSTLAERKYKSKPHPADFNMSNPPYMEEQVFDVFRASKSKGIHLDNVLPWHGLALSSAEVARNYIAVVTLSITIVA